MDATQLIREKRNELGIVRDPQGIDAVLRQLSAAEKHFERARSEGDQDLFTDVVYRANQVFEGVLKELYEVLSGQGDHNKSPHEIEAFLMKEDAFSQRIINYFTDYRTNWRNVSTHDHKLDFDEQEAFLAISTVSAFCFIVIDYMVRKAASDRASVADGAIGRDFDVTDVHALAYLLVERLPTILRALEQGAVIPTISEALLIGVLDGFFRSASGNVRVVQEPMLDLQGRQLQPDFVLEQGITKVVVELKRTRLQRTRELVDGPELRDQLGRYVEATGASAALGVVFPARRTIDRMPQFACSEVRNTDVPTLIVHPKMDQAL